MANTSKQETALNMASALITLAQSLQGVRNTASTLLDANDSLSPDTFWREMQTASVNADGSISETPDPAPVLTNPITVGSLYRAEMDLLTGLTLFIELNQFLDGTLPPDRAAVERNVTVDTLAG